MRNLSTRELIATELHGWRAAARDLAGAHTLTGTKRTVAVATIATALAGVLSTGVAEAYLVETANVSPTGTAGTITPGGAPNGTVTVTAGSTAGSAILYPGGPAGDLTMSVTNTNSRPVSVTGIQLSTAGGVTGCALTLSIPAASLPLSIPANQSTPLAEKLTGVLTMGAAATSSCEGSTLSIPLTVTVQM